MALKQGRSKAAPLNLALVPISNIKILMNNNQWVFYGSCLDGQRFEIAGVNVWSHDWHTVSESTAQVEDPRYGQGFVFPVYRIEQQGEQVTFAAGEFSNGIWGFYVRAHFKP